MQEEHIQREARPFVALATCYTPLTICRDRRGGSTAGTSADKHKLPAAKAAINTQGCAASQATSQPITTTNHQRLQCHHQFCSQGRQVADKTVPDIEGDPNLLIHLKNFWPSGHFCIMRSMTFSLTIENVSVVSSRKSQSEQAETQQHKQHHHAGGKKTFSKVCFSSSRYISISV